MHIRRHFWLLGLAFSLILVIGLFWFSSSFNKHEKASQLKNIDTFRDALSGGGEGPEMVEVPLGHFLIGSQENEPGRFRDEGPQKTVKIMSPLAVGKYEVSWAEWEECVADDGCIDNSEKNYSSLTEIKFAGDAGYGRGQRPVINVDWNDANSYATWLSKKTGKKYRLLSEAEWEYVARAGTNSVYNWGDNPLKACDHENISDWPVGLKHSTWSRVKCTDGFGDETAPVGSFPANSFGVHDMHGNVSEWTADCYTDNYSKTPDDGSAHTDGDCSYRTQRGGTWGSGPRHFRLAYRTAKRTNYRIDSLGFRVARDMD